jgi:hypothetical protein
MNSDCVPVSDIAVMQLECIVFSPTLYLSISLSIDVSNLGSSCISYGITSCNSQVIISIKYNLCLSIYIPTTISHHFALKCVRTIPNLQTILHATRPHPSRTMRRNCESYLFKRERVTSGMQIGIY